MDDGIGEKEVDDRFVDPGNEISELDPPILLPTRSKKSSSSDSSLDLDEDRCSRRRRPRE